jgi:hypothetical protein
VWLAPVLLCSLPDGIIDRGSPKSVAHEHVLLQVLGPAIGERRWVDGGTARQIAGGYAFSGFYLRDHRWLQLVLTADDVARVKLSLSPAGGPATSRTVAPVATWWRRSSASMTGRSSSPPTTRMAACSTANTSPTTTA